MSLNSIGFFHSKVVFKRLDPENDTVNNLYHHNSYDHEEKVNGLAASSQLGVFATTGNDGFLKIWGIGGTMLRELEFGETLRNVCFCNRRGDILVGFHEQIL